MRRLTRSRLRQAYSAHVSTEPAASIIPGDFAGGSWHGVARLVPATPSRAAEPVAGRESHDRAMSWVSRLVQLPLLLVQLPLLWKLVAIDVAISLVTFAVTRNSAVSERAAVIAVAFVLVLAANVGLVYWALLPLRRLEAVAVRVARGDFEARVPPSKLSDRDIARIGRSFNQLLDVVLADRARARKLAAQVIRAGDQERAYIARELHDSTAQALGAVDLLLTAALREPLEPRTVERLSVMQNIVDETWRDVRTLSHTIHPRVLDDLGLQAALELLARRTREQSGLITSAHATGTVAVPAVTASILYRVAQESVRNAVRHAHATEITIDLRVESEVARLCVADDGCGFDVPTAAAERPGMGLFVMRERVDLVRGQLEIASQVGRGTVVRAAVPFGTPNDS